MTAVILVAGTHALKDGWWKPDGPFAQALLAQGHTLPDPADPYLWDTDLDGLFGGNDNWEAAGRSLKWYAEAKSPAGVSVVAHSHGGQVAAYAASYGMRVDRLVTVGTPIRKDVPYKAAKANVKHWTHIYSDTDLWQALGEFLDGRIGTRRTLGVADKNILVPGAGHSEMLDVARWQDQGWWSLL